MEKMYPLGCNSVSVIILTIHLLCLAEPCTATRSVCLAYKYIDLQPFEDTNYIRIKRMEHDHLCKVWFQIRFQSDFKTCENT